MRPSLVSYFSPCYRKVSVERYLCFLSETKAEIASLNAENKIKVPTRRCNGESKIPLKKYMSATEKAKCQKERVSSVCFKNHYLKSSDLTQNILFFLSVQSGFITQGSTESC